MGETFAGFPGPELVHSCQERPLQTSEGTSLAGGQRESHSAGSPLTSKVMQGLGDTVAVSGRPQEMTF